MNRLRAWLERHTLRIDGDDLTPEFSYFAWGYREWAPGASEYFFFLRLPFYSWAPDIVGRRMLMFQAVACYAQWHSKWRPFVSHEPVGRRRAIGVVL